LFWLFLFVVRALNRSIRRVLKPAEKVAQEIFSIFSEEFREFCGRAQA
jgi:hypothetical protein